MIFDVKSIFNKDEVDGDFNVNSSYRMRGFYWFHTVKSLIARGDNVIGIDSLNDFYDVNLKKIDLKFLKIKSRE